MTCFVKDESLNAYGERRYYILYPVLLFYDFPVRCMLSYQKETILPELFCYDNLKHSVEINVYHFYGFSSFPLLCFPYLIVFLLDFPVRCYDYLRHIC